MKVLVVLALVLGGLVYSIMAFGPAFNDNLRVKTAMTEMVNVYGKDRDPAALRMRIADKMEGLAIEQRAGADGELVEVRPLKPEKPEKQIEVRFDEAKGVVIVRYSYTRTVNLPLLNRPSTLSFAPEVEGDIGTLAEGGR